MKFNKSEENESRKLLLRSFEKKGYAEIEINGEKLKLFKNNVTDEMEKLLKRQLEIRCCKGDLLDEKEDLQEKINDLENKKQELINNYDESDSHSNFSDDSSDENSLDVSEEDSDNSSYDTSEDESDDISDLTDAEDEIEQIDNEIDDYLEKIDLLTLTYSKLREEEKNISEKINIMEENPENTLGVLLASGGSKQVHAIWNEKIIITPNPFAILVWWKTVQDEKNISEKIKKLGLETQNYSQNKIKIESNELLVLEADSFPSLAKKGFEIRDGKAETDKQRHGNSMLFGSIENLKSSEYLCKILSGPVRDIKILLSNKISLNRDSFNLVIKNLPGREKEIKLFFYDFTSQNNKSFDMEKEIIITPSTKNQEISNSTRRQYANDYLEYTISAITSALKTEEIAKISGQGVNSENNISRFSINEMINDTFQSIKSSLVEDIVNCTKSQVTYKTSDLLKKYSVVNSTEKRKQVKKPEADSFEESSRPYNC